MSAALPTRLEAQAHVLAARLAEHPSPRAIALVDRAFARWLRRADAAPPPAPRTPPPTSETLAKAKKRGYDIIECIVAGVRVGYYAFLDGRWLGLNKRGRIPASYSAAFNALDRARAAQQGVTPGRAYLNQRTQTAQYAGR
ncbi:MAG TPA: hypothetical protein VGE07_23560 [Herpetosiphonaceae bacterium]